MGIDLNQIEALGVEPIPGESPGGVNLAGEDEFDGLQRDFRSLTALGHGGGEDGPRAVGADEATWESLGERAIRLLRERSKNIQVASMLIVGLFQEEGLPGLAAGVKLADNFLANFWETMFPPLKLIKGRASALEFMSTFIAGESGTGGGLLTLKADRVLGEFREMIGSRPTAGQFEAAYEELMAQERALAETKTTLASIKAKIYEKFPQDKLPVLTGLNEAVETKLRDFQDEVRKNKPKDPAAAPAQTPASGAAAAPRTSAPAPRPAASAMPEVSANDPSEVYAALAKLAPILREADPTDPAAYRLARLGVWGKIQSAPPTEEGDETRVPPGDADEQAVESCKNLMQSANWMNLLKQCEERFPEAPLWLDQQGYIHKALKGMGPAFAAAAEAVRDETARFLKRVPAIENLKFAGGMPFADETTKQWIDETVMAGPAGGEGGGARRGSGSADGTSKELDEALGQARELAAEGKLTEAIDLLQNGPPRSRSLRQSFLWRAALARVIQESGKARLTRPLWESLLEDIDRFKLDAWEPELSVPVLNSLYRALKSDKETASRAEEIFARLCRVDLNAALGLDKG